MTIQRRRVGELMTGTAELVLLKVATNREEVLTSKDGILQHVRFWEVKKTDLYPIPVP